ncbi:hypothetical protein [Xanthomonas phaseoli]|nr:hypothetical protein [Xanthomonas phaseoli]
MKTLLGQRAFGLDEDVHARGDSMAWPWRAAMVGKKKLQKSVDSKKKRD